MDTAMRLVVPIAVVVVAIVLAAGLWNMMRGGPANTSQKLMRARVIAQFAAIVLMMAALWMIGR